MPDRNGHPLLRSIFDLQERCHRLMEAVSESRSRSQGMEIIMAVLLAKILASEPDKLIVMDCLSELERIQCAAFEHDPPEFPDPKLLAEVISIIYKEAPQPWRPQVLVGGKLDPQNDT